ncbi:MAG: peptide MFS transporter [Acidobacteria bacterium]|nr:peptide MFS transporter [Acidobacteriota bacterium]
MSATTMASPDAQTSIGQADRSGIGGHPSGLTTLFFTEMWERFSYYGMRAILVLYMVAPLSIGGLEFPTVKATSIYGAYTSAVYFTNLFGGWLADKFFGARLAVLLGGIIIASGHFCMAVPAMPFFYLGLVLIALGTGLLKPNISTMVGGLYGKDDPRRDSGFSIFYMGINVGAMLAPIVCGYIGQRLNWHLGFAAAGVGMLLGLVQYLAHRQRLASVGNRPESKKFVNQKTVNQETINQEAVNQITNQQALTQVEKRRLAVVFILYFFSLLFWMAFEQSGSSFALFAQNHTRTELFGLAFPSSWLQSVNSIFILALAPVFSWLWLRLKDQQPSSPAKFAGGLLFVGLGMAVLAIAASFIGSGKVSPLWLIAVYFIHTLGELCLSPVGLSTVSKLAPARLVGVMMGLWFLSVSIGNYLAGQLAGFYQDNSAVLVRLFGALAIATMIGAAALTLLLPFIKRLTAPTKS